MIWGGGGNITSRDFLDVRGTTLLRLNNIRL